VVKRDTCVYINKRGAESQEIMENISQESRDFLALPEQTTHFTCMGHTEIPNDTAIQMTMVKGSISFRSSDTEERALEVAERFYETLKEWIGEIYHPEREIERWLSSKVSQPIDCASLLNAYN
jgi:hypothetical protein